MIPIGIVGPTASGKGTLSKFLEDNTVSKIVTLSDIIKEEAVEKGIDPKIRENLQNLGDQLRREHGPDILVKLALKKLKNNNLKYALIDGVRAIPEVNTIKNLGGYILGLDSKLIERHKRHNDRLEKKDDLVDLKKFKERDESDRFGNPKDPASRNIESCLSLADYLIWNDSPFEEKNLYGCANDFIKLIEGKDRRPSWEEIFMFKSSINRLRSTCLRRNVGATLVKDNREIASGYNGQASGTKHCKDLGCYREEMKIPSGERRELCRAMHAELNAILQCAVYGPSTKDTTLYVTISPCSDCTKAAIQSKISEVIYFGYYPDKFAEQMWRDSPSTSFRRHQGVTPIEYPKVFNIK